MNMSFNQFCMLQISFPTLRVVFHCLICVLSHFSQVQLFETLWTVAHQTPLSMGFSRQEYWSGLPCPPPGALPDPEIEPTSLMSPVLAGRFFITHTTFTPLMVFFDEQICNNINVILFTHLFLYSQCFWGIFVHPKFFF